jgi:hypothetical protein
MDMGEEERRVKVRWFRPVVDCLERLGKACLEECGWYDDTEQLSEREKKVVQEMRTQSVEKLFGERDQGSKTLL